MKSHAVVVELKANHRDLEIARFLRDARSFFHKIRKELEKENDNLTSVSYRIKTVPQPPYSPDLAPCDFCLFPKLTGCRYETIEEMKEAVTKVIDTLTQEDFHGAF